MHTPVYRRTTPALALLAAFASPSMLTAQTWSAAGDGNWSVNTNWTPNTVPDTGNTATLGDTAANRTITYDSGASGTVGTLVIDQTTAGFTNTVNIQRNLTLTNALALGAAAGTEQVIVGSNTTAGFQLTSTNGITLNSGGVLGLTATFDPNAFTPPATVSTTYRGASLSSGTNVTISGGTLNILASSGTGTNGGAVNTINGNFTMTGGVMHFDNDPGTADRRLDLRGATINIAGGAITADRNGALLQFQSTAAATITLNPTTFESTKIGLNLHSDFAQNISTSQTLGVIALRGTGVKTLTSTASGNGIGALTFWDINSGTASSATTLRLGSNLTLNSTANQPSFVISGGNVHELGRVDAAINTNGFTLDLTAGAGSGVWTPAAVTQSGVTNSVWNLSGSGSIRANAFNFSTANVTTNVSAGTILNAAGGNNTANNLGSLGTISPTSIFRYSGSAAVNTPATLTFARSLGQLEVTSGALRVLAGATGTIAGASVSGGTLDLDGTARTFDTLSLTGGTLSNGTFSLSSGNFTGLQTGTVSAQLSGASAFVKDSAGTLTLSGNNNFGSGQTFTINQGTIVAGHVNAFGSTSQVIVNGGTADLGGLAINKWFNLGANGGSITNGTIARNTANNATFSWQAGTVSASVTESGGGIVSINKTSPGTLIISGHNAHSGTTTISSGTLIAAHANAFGTGAVTISGGSLHIGDNSAFTVSLGSNSDLNLDSGNLLFDLGTSFDQIIGSGSGRFLLNGGSLAFTLGDGFNYGSTYQLFSGFSGSSVVSQSLGFSGFDTNLYVAQLGTDGVLSFNVIPEPSTYAAFAGLGALGLAAFRRRRRAC